MEQPANHHCPVLQIDYHPFGEDLETTVTDSVSNYVNAWLKVWMSLKCLPTWNTDLKGRVLLDLLNEPDAVEIRWGGGGRQAPLEDYYFSVMDAIDQQAPGQAVFLVQVRGSSQLKPAGGNKHTLVVQGLP